MTPEQRKHFEFVRDEMHGEPKQEQGEPERCHGCEACINSACGRDECPKGWPKAPQQRTWVGLTVEEIFETHKQVDSMQYLTFGKAIEAKLKEKNT